MFVGIVQKSLFLRVLELARKPISLGISNATSQRLLQGLCRFRSFHFSLFFCVFLVLLVYYHFPREKSLFDSHPTIFRHTRTAPSKIKQIQPSWGRVLWLAPSPIAHKSPGGSQAGKSRSSW
jgi:hypothetical protein